MARFVVSVLVLVGLVGGYVVGQTLESKVVEPNTGASPNPIIVEQQLRDGVGVINDLAPPDRAVEPRTGPVGRYVPFGVGQMLDTTNGTLYAMEGNPTRWNVVAKFGETTQANLVVPPLKPQ